MRNNTESQYFNHFDLNEFVKYNGTIEILPSVAKVFSTILPDWLDDVHRSISQIDQVSLINKLHNMKNNCAMFGAHGLAEKIDELQEYIEQDGIQSNRSLIDEVIEQVRQLDAEIITQLRTISIRS